MSSTGSTMSLDALPAELVLNVIPHISYSPASLTGLRLVSRKMNALITAHEQGLVADIKRQQYTPATLMLFPSLPHSYDGLRTMHLRNQTLDDLHAHWLHVTNHGPDLGWMRDRWENIHKAGMLLLYRLYDAGNPATVPSSQAPCCQNALIDPTDAQRDLLNLLPATSLACLVFKLYSSIKILRIYGPEPICASYAKDDVETRCDVELAFEEMLLRHGPDFFVIMLQAGRAVDETRKKWAIDTLTCEIAHMEHRQLHNSSPTLISTLRRAFANKMECHIMQNTTKMWELLSSTAFDRMGEVEMGKVVRGESLATGMRRMAY